MRIIFVMIYLHSLIHQKKRKWMSGQLTEIFWLIWILFRKLKKSSTFRLQNINSSWFSLIFLVLFGFSSSFGSSEKPLKLGVPIKPFHIFLPTDLWERFYNFFSHNNGYLKYIMFAHGLITKMKTWMLYFMLITLPWEETF